LRERPGDVALLAHRFVQDHAKVAGARLSSTALRQLEAHDWPGNVRELENAIERACLLSSGSEIRSEFLPEEIQTKRARPLPAPMPASDRTPEATFHRFDKQELDDAMAAQAHRVEKEFVVGLLAAHGGNVSKAAAESGIHRSHLQRMMARVKE
jgi:DNA-binding NtrC family response regulator